MRSLPESLRYISQRASNAFVSGKSNNLSSAVKEAVQGHSLNDDEKHRVVEMTNRMTWQSLYSSSDDKTFQFDPAQPSDLVSSEPAQVVSAVPTGALVDRVDPGPTQFPVQEYMNTQPTDPAQRPLELAAEAKVAAQERRAQRWGALAKVASAKESFIDQVVDARFHNELSGKEIVVAVSDITTNPDAAALLIKEAFERVRDMGLSPQLDVELPSLYEVDVEHKLLKTYAEYEGAYQDVNAHEKAAAFLTEVAEGAEVRARLGVKK
tara:strand:+ start:2217 stop:3014 length:798 start_codon:yes stop_codon:yes gene_type:complete